MEAEKQTSALEYRIYVLRNCSIPVNLLAIVQLIIAVALHDVLTVILKTWLITVAGCLFIGLTVALTLTKNDSTTTLFLTLLSALASGFIGGISLVVIVIKIKN
jgi:hypothetical protein